MDMHGLACGDTIHLTWEFYNGMDMHVEIQ